MKSQSSFSSCGIEEDIFITFLQHHNLSAISLSLLLIVIKHKEYFCVKKCASCLKVIVVGTL